MINPEQAVILCGGRGTRLKPITDNLPKALAPVNEKPFIEYLLNQLVQQGIKKIVLLTGYLGHLIKERIGDGSRFGVSIIYSHGPIEWETGERIWFAKNKLDPFFFLLYCDNYAPFSKNRMVKSYDKNKSTVTLLLHPKPKGNIRIENGYKIEVYDASRKLPNLNYVEVGYMLVEREKFLASLDIKNNLSFTLQSLVKKNEINGIINNTIYSSISDIERLKKTENHLRVKKIILIDRDGTINEKPPHGEYLTEINKIKLIDRNILEMKSLSRAGFKFIVLTNQAGISRNLITISKVRKINSIIQKKLVNENISILAWYICPHHWNDACSCRKPEPGMLMQASQDFNLWLEKTFFIGDDSRDMEAAINAGAVGIYIGNKKQHELNQNIDNYIELDNIHDLSKKIFGQYSKL